MDFYWLSYEESGVCACSKTIHHGVVIGFQYSALQASFTLSHSNSGTMSCSLSRCSHCSYICRPSWATLTCCLVFSVGVFIIPFFPSRIDIPQTVQGMIGPSLSSPLSIRHPSWARVTSCVVLVGCLGGGVHFPLFSVPTWHLQSSICSSLFRKAPHDTICGIWLTWWEYSILPLLSCLVGPLTSFADFKVPSHVAIHLCRALWRQVWCCWRIRTRRISCHSLPPWRCGLMGHVHSARQAPLLDREPLEKIYPTMWASYSRGSVTLL